MPDSLKRWLSEYWACRLSGKASIEKIIKQFIPASASIWAFLHLPLRAPRSGYEYGTAKNLNIFHNANKRERHLRYITSRCISQLTYVAPRTRLTRENMLTFAFIKTTSAASTKLSAYFMSTAFPGP